MEIKSPRITAPTLKILKEMIVRPDVAISGAEIARKTGLPSGTLYPILFRLERSGWLESHWEDIDPAEVKRPRKRLYSITAIGEIKIKDSFRELMPASTEILWQS